MNRNGCGMNTAGGYSMNRAGCGMNRSAANPSPGMVSSVFQQPAPDFRENQFFKPGSCQNDTTKVTQVAEKTMPAQASPGTNTPHQNAQMSISQSSRAELPFQPKPWNPNELNPRMNSLGNSSLKNGGFVVATFSEPSQRDRSSTERRPDESGWEYKERRQTSNRDHYIV